MCQSSVWKEHSKDSNLKISIYDVDNQPYSYPAPDPLSQLKVKKGKL
jgi:hypothetical protein